MKRSLLVQKPNYKRIIQTKAPGENVDMVEIAKFVIRHSWTDFTETFTQSVKEWRTKIKISLLEVNRNNMMKKSQISNSWAIFSSSVRVIFQLYALVRPTWLTKKQSLYVIEEEEWSRETNKDNWSLLVRTERINPPSEKRLYVRKIYNNCTLEKRPFP